jgi:hypothetical protein
LARFISLENGVELLLSLIVDGTIMARHYSCQARFSSFLYAGNTHMELTPKDRIREMANRVPEGEISATARACGVTPSYFRRIRKAGVNIGVNSVPAFCAVFKVSADELLGITPPDPAVIAAEKLKREEEADAEFQADLLRGLEQIRARIAKGPKGARK